MGVLAGPVLGLAVVELVLVAVLLLPGSVPGLVVLTLVVVHPRQVLEVVLAMLGLVAVPLLAAVERVLVRATLVVVPPMLVTMGPWVEVLPLVAQVVLVQVALAVAVVLVERRVLG